MYKSGLKLWSVNTDYYLQAAKELYNKGIYDYIELYIVPDSTNQISKWANLDIPFMLHAPHFAHGLNLAVQEKFEYNQKIYKEVELYRKNLNAGYTVVHGGIEGDIKETIRQLNIIKPKNFLIENKPYRAPLGEKKLCRGYSPQEIEKVIKETGCGFCLDIGHAICSANSQGFNPYAYLKEFNNLKPSMYHLSDNNIDSSVDKHMHIGTGDYNFTKIFDIIDTNKYISIETNKNSKENLDDFMEDIKCLKKYMK